jgi:rod shape-determining protein MreB
MKDGVIADDKYIIEMLRRFLKKVQGNGFLKSAPRVLISVPGAATPAQRKTIYGAAEKIGASEIFMIDEPMAAAIGAKLPVEQSVGSMVVDIGGGTTDIAIISINDMVYSDSINMAGDHFNVAIMDYVRKNQKIAIGEQTAERIKHEIGSAFPMEEVKEVEVRGRSLDGIPVSFKLDSNQIEEALKEPLRKIVDAVKKALEQCPAEVSADICERGIYLTGGGALLSGIDQLLRNETGLPVVIADDPLTCVALGGFERLKQLVGPKKSLYNP